MQLYDCSLRLNGSMLNVVRKFGVTAAEIAVLKHIHGRSPSGAEPVIEIVQAGTVARSDSQERARLANRYNRGAKKGEELVQKLLGITGVPLPAFVPGVDEPEAVEEEIVAPKRTKVPVADKSVAA
jgi:hypothetical protein